MGAVNRIDAMGEMDVIGLDVGGTSIKGARVGADGGVLAELTCATPSDAAALTAAVIALAGELSGPDTSAVAVVCPGDIDGGTVRFAANLAWRDEPVVERLHEALGVPVVLSRDVAAAALAESAQITGDDVLFVWLGTGVASAHVSGGSLRAGATGRAGELGHIPVHPDGIACGCGQRGCLEAYASASAVARRYLARTGQDLGAERVVARLSGGDAVAEAVWADAVDALAVALATVTLIDDPAVVVLGGGLALAGDTLLDPLRTALTGRLAWRRPPELTLATLGPAAGRLGAAQLAWRAVAPRPEHCEQEGTPS